jgi:hypothetical protein
MVLYGIFCRDFITYAVMFGVYVYIYNSGQP